MKTRPQSITFIGYYLVIISTLGLLGMMMVLSNPDPKEIGEALSKELTILLNPDIQLQYEIFLALFITLVSGIGILKGKNWARLLYVIWGIITYIIEVLTYSIQTDRITGLIIFSIAIFFLFRPKANRYFS